MLMLQAPSSGTGIETFRVACILRLSSSRWAATEKDATTETFFSRHFIEFSNCGWNKLFLQYRLAHRKRIEVAVLEVKALVCSPNL